MRQPILIALVIASFAGAGLAQVARECGFGSPDSLRRSFLRVLRVAPADYRRRLHRKATPVFAE